MTAAATRTSDFRLAPEESLAEGVRRVLTGQLDDALEMLHREPDLDTAVHEMRKCLKRSRAVLRLVRPVIGEDAFARENATLRDIARPWGSVRDSAVLVETAGSVAADTGVEGADPVVRHLEEAAVQVRSAAHNDRDLPLRTITTLEEVRSRVAVLTSGPEWTGAAPGPGVKRVLRRARRGRKASARTGDPHTLHRWRKDVKYLTYQAELLVGLARPGSADLARRGSTDVSPDDEVGARTAGTDGPALVDPGAVEDLADQLADLGSLLGDDHDLAVLVTTLAEDADLSDATRAGWLHELERRRSAIQDEAFPLGKAVLRRAKVLTTVGG